MQITAATANSKSHWTYGDAIAGCYVTPRQDNSREFQSEERAAVIVGFSAPYWVVARNLGWLGSVLVRFEDGTKSWQALYPRAA